MKENVNRKALFEIHLKLLEPFKGKTELMVMAFTQDEAYIKTVDYLDRNYQIKVDKNSLEIVCRWYLADGEIEIFY